MDSEKKPDPPAEPYSAAYLAMNASNRQRERPPMPRAPRRGVGAGAILLLVILAAVAYLQRDRFLAVLRPQPPAEQTGLPLTSLTSTVPLTSLTNAAGSGGGERSFQMGAGFGTVTADDGSDRFRVMTPPPATNR